MPMLTEQTAADAADPRGDATAEDERGTEQRDWLVPDFEEIALANEVTAYVGRW